MLSSRRFAGLSLALMSLALSTVMFTSSAFSLELSRRERSIIAAVIKTLERASELQFTGNTKEATELWIKAAGQMQKVIDQGNPDVYEELSKGFGLFGRLHARLELDGASMPPYHEPGLSSDAMVKQDEDKPMEPTNPGEPNSIFSLVSFTKEVGPILLNRCGRCHVNRSSGGFSAASYASLMKGPPAGVVVFARDVASSVLIETIESREMPPNGNGIPAEDLKKLKDWIAQGANFDGEDPNQRITAGEQAAAPMPETELMVVKATGRESVSFSRDIAPLLVENCNGCHINAMQTRGGLNMDTFAQLLRGGDSGAIITPGKGEESLLVKKLRGTAAEGVQMPAGGRPALPDDSIALISKWIDEGATIDADERAPLERISRLAWAAAASAEELTARRREIADKNIRLANATAAPEEVITDHFRIVGTASQATLEIIGRESEKHLAAAQKLAKPSGERKGENFFRGRATIFVLPRRYDYSEFSKMVESRAIPGNWSAHWRYDGIDAYIAMVANDSAEPDEISSTLVAPVTSLAIATRNPDVPRWFAWGLGNAQAMNMNAADSDDKERLQLLASQAAAEANNAKVFLGNRLTPEQTDSLSTAIGMAMLDRSKRRGLEAALRQLTDGLSFEQSFQVGFKQTPEQFVDAFLKYVRR